MGGDWLLWTEVPNLMFRHITIGPLGLETSKGKHLNFSERN
jgi:hypothetical protein